MVDFRKQLARPKLAKPVDPLEIYEGLDRESDKGPLRPVQSHALTEWFTKRRADKDVILKLHTGQGKTLIGLLILQSQLNQGANRAMYLCPNNMLVEQTREQARQFGITAVASEGELPSEFLESRAILITTAAKLFNGLTQFGLGSKSRQVHSLVIDDSHACVDAIREKFLITLPKTHPAFSQILDLFAVDLEAQGSGTHAEIKMAAPDVLLPVPYWAWSQHSTKVTHILAASRTTDELRFVWPLLKDTIEHCQCVVSGQSLQIIPRRAPLELFGTFANASHRVFMSATVTEDSFLVKGLGLSEQTIRNPLIHLHEKWSGEKMILIPSLIDESLNRDAIIKTFGVPRDPAKARFGIVVLAPSFRLAAEWKAVGANVSDTSTINSNVSALRKGNRRHLTSVFANRYDGIDLPDDSCRILILDSRPRPETLLDRYDELCRPKSDVIAMKLARVIEQGLGRSVRGERDYSVVVLTGGDLVRHLRAPESRQFLSDQTRRQIDIGLEAASLAKQDIADGSRDPAQVVAQVINQCLLRDGGWKAFYAQEMNDMQSSSASASLLAFFASEDQAERHFQNGNIEGAIKEMQSLIDRTAKSAEDQAWYLQELARYKSDLNLSEANGVQLKAHRLNPRLLKPRTGLIAPKLAAVTGDRLSRLIGWVSGFEDYQALSTAIQEVLDTLRFGTEASVFEQSLDTAGKALGFVTDRPDHHWKEGPDNLWTVRSGEFILFECKNQVEKSRQQIHKSESGQMNNAVAWFHTRHPSATVTSIMVTPAKQLGKGAAFSNSVELMREPELKRFVRKFERFFREFRTLDLKDLGTPTIQKLLDAHELGDKQLLKGCTKRPEVQA